MATLGKTEKFFFSSHWSQNAKQFSVESCLLSIPAINHYGRQNSSDCPLGTPKWDLWTLSRKRRVCDGHQMLTWDARRHSFCGPRLGCVQLCFSCVWSQRLMGDMASGRLPEGDRTPCMQLREIIICVDFDGLVIQFLGDYPHSLSDLNKLFGSPS